MRRKIRIDRVQTDSIPPWRAPSLIRESKKQRLIIGVAVFSFAVGMALWLMGNYLTFLFLGIGILSMLATYIMEYRRNR